MEKLENVSSVPEKENKLMLIPEDFNNLSVEEAFKHKHVVFEVNECFEKTKISVGHFFLFSSTNVETKNVCPIAYNVKAFMKLWYLEYVRLAHVHSLIDAIS